MSFSRSRLFDILLLIALSVFIVAGTRDVPVHGDESTQMAMGQDAYIQFVQGDLSQIYYSPTTAYPAQQDVRLYNGSIPKYLFGFVLIAFGQTPETWQKDYDWGAPHDYNVREQRLPSGETMFYARLTSVAGLVVGLWALFALGEQLGGRSVAWLSVIFYALHPIILLNGRRAMMEGWLTGLSIVVVLVTVWVLARLTRPASEKDLFTWRDVVLYVFWGLVCGLCLASKHTGLVTVSAAFGAVGTAVLGRMFYFRWRQQPQEREILHFRAVVAAGIGTLLVFYFVNPVWWGQNPVYLTKLIYDLRADLLQVQVRIYGGYETLADKVKGFLDFVFVARPQYYEDSRFAEPLIDSIRQYESSLLAGIPMGGSVVGALVLAGLSVYGVIAMLVTRTVPQTRWVLLWWGVAMLALTVFATPLEWQRYYLPIYPLIGLCAAYGIDQLIRRVLPGTTKAPSPVARG